MLIFLGRNLINPTDCGCSPFHPTIGSEEFTISTLATPCQAMLPQGNSTPTCVFFSCNNISLFPQVLPNQISSLFYPRAPFSCIPLFFLFPFVHPLHVTPPREGSQPIPLPLSEGIHGLNPRLWKITPYFT
jgi:hypothetical protein